MINRYLIIVCIMALNLNSCHEFLYQKQLRLLYKNTVPLIQPEKLNKLKDKAPGLILLDIRSAREYAVSHLAGARLLEFNNFNLNQVDGISKEALVVVYCTVGVRSEQVGARLKSAGYTKVYNLFGGIFGWKNQGYPVVNQEQIPTEQVHTYNRYWAVWLQNGVKVYE